MLVAAAMLIRQWNGYRKLMRPLLFVNWRQVSSRFTVLMWLVACALAVVVLMHVPGASAPATASADASRSAPPVAAQLARLRH